MKWILAAFAAALACAVLSTSRASAQQRDPLIDPAEGTAGSRFQIVGQSGWTPGDTVTLTFDFADVAPGDAYAGAAYHERQVTVLRDGTWSFPIVVNQDLFPFPLWRPGYIVVKAQSPTRTAVNAYVYTVEGRRPAGLPPLAPLGDGPSRATPALATLALLLFGAGALIGVAGALRTHATLRR